LTRFWSHWVAGKIVAWYEFRFIDWHMSIFCTVFILHVLQ
jgi:hypothetical protein